MLACEIYDTLRWADIYFYQRDGKGANTDRAEVTST
jgi:glucose-6-phosphate 1-dehydrogenase